MSEEKQYDTLGASAGDRISAATLMIGMIAAPAETEDPVFDAKVKNIYDALNNILHNREPVL